MKKKYLKLLMLPILCTALSACSDGDVSTSETISGEVTLSEESTESDSESDSIEETSSIENSTTVVDSTSDSTEVTTSIVEEETDVDKVVTNVLNAYRDDDIVGKMFEGSNAIDASLNMNLDATAEDTKLEHSKQDIDMGLLSTINVNTYKDNTNITSPIKIYSESNIAGKINYAADVELEEESEETLPEEESSDEITSEYDEESIVYEPSHLITDMDVDTKFEVSDKTYVNVQGKIPNTDMIPDSEGYEESAEDLEKRSDFDFNGYTTDGYEGWKNFIDTYINDTEEEDILDEEVGEEEITDEPDFDLNDETTYNYIYDLLTGDDGNEFLTRTVIETTEGYKFEISLDISAIDNLKYLPGETIGSLLSGAFGLEGEDVIDYATIIRNSGKSNKVNLEVNLGVDFLIENMSLDLNLDGIDMEVKYYEETDENTTTEEPVIAEDYVVNINEFNISLNVDLAYGEDVLELGFNEEEKTDIVNNGIDFTAFRDALIEEEDSESESFE